MESTPQWCDVNLNYCAENVAQQVTDLVGEWYDDSL